MKNILTNAPPSLKALSFRGIRIHTDTYSISSDTITSLFFSRINLPQDIDRFISGCFPRLSKLELLNCGGPGIYRLENTDLAEFRFFPGSEEHLGVRTICNKKQRWYKFSNNDSIYYDFWQPKTIGRWASCMPYTCHSESPANTSTYFTLVCDSVKNTTFATPEMEVENYLKST